MTQQSFEVKVDGMTCDHCKRAVEKAAKSIDGVQEAIVDLKAGKVTITGTPQRQAVVNAIQAKGYKVPTA